MFLLVLSLGAGAPPAQVIQPKYDYDSLAAEVAALRLENDVLINQYATLQAKLLSQTKTTTKAACVIADFLPLEEHLPDFVFDTEEILLASVSETISSMDDAGISRMLVSHMSDPDDFDYSIPIENSTAYLRGRNVNIANAVNVSGGRFKGLCQLYMVSAAVAIPELQWCKSQGMLGVMLRGNQRAILPNGTVVLDYYYKDSSIPIWQEIARLGMVVYLHPTALYSPVPGLYQAHSITDVNGQTKHVAAYDSRDITTGCPYWFDQNSAYGFSVSAAQVVSHLIIEGVFDKVPDLKMVIGHNGESLPFLLWRVDHRLSAHTEFSMPVANPTQCQSGAVGQRAHDFAYYFKKNLFITTSGEFETPGLEYLMKTVPVDHILFSIDSPAENILNSTSWLRNIGDDQPEKCEELQKIAYKNAEALLNWSS